MSEYHIHKISLITLTRKNMVNLACVW